MSKFKKIALSVIALAVICSAAFTFNVKAVKASDGGVIDNETLSAAFVEANGVSVTANENIPDFMKTISAAQRNGVLLSFENGGTVTIGKTFKANELDNFITFLPLVDEAGKILTKPAVSEFYIDLKNAAGDKTVSYRFLAVTGANWAALGKSALSVAATDGDKTQTYAGYCLSTQWTQGTSFEGKPFLRKGNNGYTVDSGFAGSGGEQKPITLGYVQGGGKVQSTVSYKNEGGEYLCLGSDNALSDYVYNGEKIGNVVRDLNKNVTIDVVGENYDPNENDNGDIIVDKSEFMFDGFSDGDDITVTLRAASVDGVGYVLVTDIAGESLHQRVRVQNEDKIFKATAGVSYVVPQVKSYIGNEADGEDFGGTYSVIAPDGSSLNEVNVPYVSGAAFTPDVTGEYTIEYKIYAGGITYINSKKISCIENANIIFSKQSDDFSLKNVYFGVKYDIGAKATSDIYEGIKDETKVYAKIEYAATGSGYNVVFDDEVTETYKKSFDGIGNYKITYTARDGGGNEKVSDKIISFSVVRNYIGLNVQDGAELSYGTDTENFKIDRNSVKIYDYLYGADFFDDADSGIVYKIYVSYNGGEDRELSESETLSGFTFPEAFGEYKFSYRIYYFADGEKIDFAQQTFTVSVVDDASPEIYLIGDDYLIGAQKVEESGKVITYRAVNGKTVNFGYLRARDSVGENHDLSDEIKLSAIYNSKEFSVDSDYASGPENFGFTFLNNGEYLFKFSVKDSFGNADEIILKIIVKNGFYTLSGTGAFKDSYSTLDAITPSDFTVIDQDGNVAASATKNYELTRDGEAVEINGGKYELLKSGDYVFRYIASVNGEIVEKVYEFKVVDKTAPVITVSGTVYKTGVVNKYVKIADFSAIDNETSVNKTITVKKGDEEINVFDGKFIPDEAGEYVVTFKAVDENGNISEYAYVITVSETAVKRPRIFAIIGFSVGGALIAAAVALIIAAKFKKVKKAENGDKE